MAKRLLFASKKKKIAYVIIFMAVIALVLTSALGYFGFGSFSPPLEKDTAKSIGEVIEELNFSAGQYKDSLEKNPDNLYVLAQLGNTYFYLGDIYSSQGDETKAIENFELAVEIYGRALELEPDNVDIHINRGIAAFRCDDLDMSENDFQTAISLDPSYARPYYHYGELLFFGKNRPKDAILQWERVVKLNPDDDPELVENARDRLSYAEEYIDNPPDTNQD